jgi:glycosyltransferase involved in cell wall biosynthesis
MPQIAIVVPDFEHGGGVPMVAQFIYQVLTHSQRYKPFIISTATSASDQNSIRLFSPMTWRQGVQITQHFWREKPVQHVGAYLTELEFQRYMPRKQLTKLLNQFDLIQVVSGTPALALAATKAQKPVCLFAATLAQLERRSIIQKSSKIKGSYSKLMLPLISALEKRALRRVDHLFAETEYTKNAMIQYVNPTKVSIDTIGVDIDRFTPGAEIIRSDDFILSVGRFADPRKNASLLFDSYARLRQRIPDVPKLVLAGRTIPSSTDWARAEQLGIAEHIVLKQDISLNELVALYQNAAFFVLSSNEEGLGIVLLESMACATPVISTRCGGPDSVVTDEVGFLTSVGDADEMAERMSWMLSNPHERRQMGEAGRAMVERRFSNQVVGQKYLDVYDELLGI